MKNKFLALALLASAPAMAGTVYTTDKYTIDEIGLGSTGHVYLYFDAASPSTNNPRICSKGDSKAYAIDKNHANLYPMYAMAVKAWEEGKPLTFSIDDTYCSNGYPAISFMKVWKS